MIKLCFARKLAALAIFAVTALGGVPAQAQSWPSKPVKVIMATAAGSAPDVIARIVTDRLSQMWGQQVLIINRPGAGGLIALQALAAAERDGHTLYLPSSSSLVVLPVTNANLPLGIERDLVPIGLVGEQPFMIVASNTLGVNTLPEFIALAKSKPKELTYAANFRGSLPNMTGEMVPRPRRHRADLRALSRRAAGPAGRAGRPGVGDGRRARGLRRPDALRTRSSRSASPRRSGCRTIRTCRPSPKPFRASTRAAGSCSWASPGRRTTCAQENQCGRALGAGRARGARSASRRWPPMCAISRRSETGQFIRDEQAAWRPVVQKVGVTSP